MATIGFSTKFPWGEETHFVPKIWEGIIEYGLFPQWASLPYLLLAEGKNFDYLFKKEGILPKIHTIREDKADLWKPGRKIHPVVFNRTKDRFQFAPVLECRGVQKIRIAYTDLRVVVEVYFSGSSIHSSRYNSAVYDVYKNDNDFPVFEKVRDKIGMEELAQNEGFDSVQEFFWYFNKDFSGKIIHWIDFEY